MPSYRRSRSMPRSRARSPRISAAPETLRLSRQFPRMHGRRRPSLRAREACRRGFRSSPRLSSSSRPRWNYSQYARRVGVTGKTEVMVVEWPRPRRAPPNMPRSITRPLSGSRRQRMWRPPHHRRAHAHLLHAQDEPRLRARKYAVRCGPVPIRFGLDDAMLIRTTTSRLPAASARCSAREGRRQYLRSNRSRYARSAARVLEVGWPTRCCSTTWIGDRRGGGNGRRQVSARTLRRHHSQHERRARQDRSRLRLLGLDHPFGPASRRRARYRDVR